MAKYFVRMQMRSAIEKHLGSGQAYNEYLSLSRDWAKVERIRKQDYLLQYRALSGQKQKRTALKAIPRTKAPSDGQFEKEDLGRNFKYYYYYKVRTIDEQGNPMFANTVRIGFHERKTLEIAESELERCFADEDSEGYVKDIELFRVTKLM
jgi:hypothetical protein